MPVHPRIRSDRLILTMIPGIREGQLQGGGTILRNGARTGPGQTTAIRRPWIGCERALPAHWQAPLGLYAAFNAAPSGRTPARQNRHNATSSFLAKATIITLRIRLPTDPVLLRNHAASLLSG